jgi:hypothetical protein
MDKIRVLRVIEYEGDRDAVEEQVRVSLHGERKGMHGRCTIRAATIGLYPEILQQKED